ncbi:glycosyltransferase family 9 protein [Aestuariirhabdus litorea]|uniref:ADP-heptose--LPS heptosyltransferase n=1 Tax=Aestuariirhabdus litorea TaxID=2528527 RepID=A0A3P3VMR5_9GAMM|nr:glycosyltransferase family 9 protein [Aestuariirhabdus litorea]RRJ83019.1 ADP-heptose--LPS heptosyltransferase [Aestuariirhabdus litorea]RWW93177.1 ADP-heptose--LPS heptosyltransferase [Endozoicomonadaceae bacterium GTF-13]
MRQLILRNFQSPGDILMLTAAVRDLHAHYPGQFQTDVRTPCPALWEHNPYLCALSESDPGVELIDCQYPLINHSNQLPYHFIHGFIDHLNQQLQLAIKPTRFGGDIHLSAAERSWISQVQEQTREPLPFWVLVAGGKYDFSIKWWASERFQQVVDHFQGRLLFVQVGEANHHHPALRGVLNLREKTNLRQLVRLVHHAEGVLCPVTLAMHLAAAVEPPAGRPGSRPCVVVAGGREPVHWEAYPHHQFLHTLGALPCCSTGGCWRSRTLPLGDGDPKDHPDQRCLDVVGSLPRCMEMIRAADVIRAIDYYLDGGRCSTLSPAQARCLAPLLSGG